MILLCLIFCKYVHLLVLIPLFHYPFVHYPVIYDSVGLGSVPGTQEPEPWAKKNRTGPGTAKNQSQF